MRSKVVGYLYGCVSAIRGKPTLKDQLRFFHIAMGSVRECQAILMIAEMQATAAWNTLDSLAAHLFCLIRANTV